MAARVVKAHHSFSLDTWEKKKKSLKKCLQGAAERWKPLQVRWPSTGKCSTNRFLVHVVKGGETLTSISRQYGVSIQSIAAVNASIVDIDLVLEGERLNIPVSSEEMQMDSSTINGKTLNRCQSSSNIRGTHEIQKILSQQSFYHSQIAKPIVCLLVLAPLITLCISFMIEALRHRVFRKTKHQEPNQSQAPYCGSRTTRWRTILHDHRVSDTLDAPSQEDSVDHFGEDQSLIPLEEMSHEYSKLESTYLKFLSECGMGRWGYWHGGSPE